MFNRIVKISKTHSFFLFGPRAVGKSTLLLEMFPANKNLWIDLLDPKLDRTLRHNPEHLEGLIDSAKGIDFVVVDEIQKNPLLLDVIHRLIFKKKIKFALTGSSARKLKKGAANLLAGRSFTFECFPLTHVELGDSFKLEEVLAFGSLPEIFSLELEDKAHFLRAYIETYFKEEIVAEQLVRNLLPFRNFLEIASQSNGKILNYQKIADDIQVDNTTVQNYFTILEDTHVGFMLPPYHASIRKRQRQKSKFYYFDLGVQRALSGRIEIPLIAGNYEFGDAFEHFIILELKRLAKYLKPDWKLSYFMSADNTEIDLIIERPGQKLALIEIKSTDDFTKIEKTKLTGFKRLIKDFKNSEAFIVSRDSNELILEDIHYVHWRNIFKMLGLS